MPNVYEKNIISEMDSKLEKKRKSPDALLKKRFSLPKSKELRAKLKDLQETITEFKKENPEAVCLLLYGSFVKGYATEKSDFDGFLVISKDAIKDQIKKKSLQKSDETEHLLPPSPKMTGGKDFPRLPTGEDFLEMQAASKAAALYFDFKNKLKQKGFSEEQIEHLRPEIFSKEGLLESFRKDPRSIAHLFMMAVGGNEISNYRQIIFDELESLDDPQLAKYRWQDIMCHLHTAERRVNGNLAETWSLYPETIEDGKKLFLKN